MSYRNMPDTTRVWVYQSTRALTKEESNEIQEKGNLFAGSWTSHDKPLKADIKVFYNRFIVIFADEAQTQASGCAIDKSMAFIKETENRYNISLLDRMVVAYRTEHTIEGCSFSEFKRLLEQGKLSENTIVFNNLVSSKKEWENKWEIPVKESWHCSLLI